MEIDLKDVDDIVLSLEEEIDKESISKAELRLLLDKIKTNQIGEIKFSTGPDVLIKKVDLNKSGSYLLESIDTYPGTIYNKIRNNTITDNVFSSRINSSNIAKITFIHNASQDIIYFNSEAKVLDKFLNLDYFLKQNLNSGFTALCFSDIKLARQIVELKRLYKEVSKYIGSNGFKHTFIKE